MKVSQVFHLLSIITLLTRSCNAQDTISDTLTSIDATAANDTIRNTAVGDTSTEEVTLDLDELPITATVESSINTNTSNDNTSNNNTTNNNSNSNNNNQTSKIESTASTPVQSGPFIDLLGPSLLSLEMVDASSAQLVAHYTNEVLAKKKVVGLYFSADWCGPCRKFTPELVAFYNKMNARKGRTNDFEIVWISRCRDFNAFGQYFTQMNWLAMPPEDAQGKRGQLLSDKYKVKGIPSLVLLDEIGNVITTDARNKIPMDKAGIGFPWRNPVATLYMTIFPKSLRLMVKGKVMTVKDKLFTKVRTIISLQR